MERPTWLGAGRGRGRGAPSSTTIAQQPVVTTKPTSPLVESAVQRAEAFAHQTSQAAAKFKEVYGDAASSDEDNDPDGLSSASPSANAEQVVWKLFGKFGDEDKQAFGDQAKARIVDAVRNASSKEASTCLVCLSGVRRQQPTWHCKQCFALFHLQCMQSWIKDGHGPSSKDKPKEFFCPKCRKSYEAVRDFPSKYKCYCGKTTDPIDDPWLPAHSCGETCERPLVPSCNHVCILLCHPGPCPPCPQMVKVQCHCGRVSSSRRCYDREFSCANKCQKLLLCKKHTCQQPCHSGECPPCALKDQFHCRCRRTIEVRPCAQLDFQCNQVCDLPLSCGNHRCTVVCHAGVCPPCPRAGIHTCPCGKTAVSVKCTEVIPTCPDTCGKSMDCGKHQCALRCHRDGCGTCRVVEPKTCRCGSSLKTLPCFQSFTCEKKCTEMKPCGRHPCKRKCCPEDVDCPPCEEECNRPLNCQNHRCASKCHGNTPCYPCTKTKTVSCRCGQTTLTLPCGREKSVKPPKCREQCRVKRSCHHGQADLSVIAEQATRAAHACHFGNCPACRLPCLRVHSCGHRCFRQCHDPPAEVLAELAQLEAPLDRAMPSVLDQINEAKRREQAAKERESMIRKYSCPPCETPVTMLCHLGHESSDMPCVRAHPYDCGQLCGKMLSCGNCTCQSPCRPHQCPSICDNKCSIPRSGKCTHPCMLPCHRGPCAPCKAIRSVSCHCGGKVLNLRCRDEQAADLGTDLLTCGNKCAKKMECGHTCPIICHLGPCKSASECNKKVTIRCACKRLKEERPCQDRNIVLRCDDECEQTKLNELKAIQEKTEAEFQRQEKIRLAEIEEFERKKIGKKRKLHARREYEDEIVVVSWTDWLKEHKFAILTVAMVLLALVGVMMRML